VRTRDRVSLAFGGAALLASVLVIGGAVRWAQALVAALVALALVSQIGSRRRLARASPIVVLVAVAIGLTAVQLIPLPSGLLSALNPHGNELRSDGAAIAGTAPWQSISLDPSGTLRALAVFIIVLGVAVLGLRFASSERGRYLVLGGVAITCGLAAAVTGFHTLLNADHLYGVYRPLHATPPILGPLLNPNHLGGLMALGAVLAIGLTFYQRQATQVRVLWVVIGIGCSVTALASLSRGATLALCLGVATTIALMLAGKLATGGEEAGRRRALINEIPIAIVIAFGLAAAVYTSAGRVADQLENTTLVELNQPLSKYAAWRSSLTLVEETPWVGIGRGALEPAFTRVHEPSAYVTFSHLENEYLQAVVEWGVPGAIVLGLLLAWAIFAGVKHWRDGALAAAAIGGCAAVMFQSSVDFGVELLGVAVPVTLVATTLLGVPLRESRSLATRGARAALIVALVGAAAVLALSITRTIQEDHDALTGDTAPQLAEVSERRSREDQDDRRARAARDVVERHPLDYLAFGESAAQMLRTGDARAARFLNHALRLHPTHPGLHRLAARMLLAAGRRSQAAIEYAHALHGMLAPKNLIIEIVALFPEVELAAAALPINAVNRDQILRSLYDLGHEDIALRWLERVVLGTPRDLAMIDELYRLALRRHDLPTAERAARRRLVQSRTHVSRIMLARVMFRQEQFDQVLKDLADVPTWRGRIDQQADAWFLMCDSQIEKRAWDPALQCLHKLDGSGIISNARRVDVIKRLNIVNEQRTIEAKRKAIEAMERALGSRPKSP
jgi:O-antigen ligase/tetratricopeptide (TPR) repeat protein